MTDDPGRRLNEYEDDSRETYVPSRQATFTQRLLHLPDMVQEVFHLETPYERNVLSLSAGSILPSYYEDVLVMATSNDLVRETVVYSHVPGSEEDNSVVLNMLPGVVDVSEGLRSIGYLAVYPEGAGPVQVPSVPTSEGEPTDPLDEEG